MSAMSDLQAQAAELGTLHSDGDGDLWVEVGEDRFSLVLMGATAVSLGKGVLTRAQVESDCGRLELVQ